jgi:Trk K+ transport system NAD-binding subunit
MKFVIIGLGQFGRALALYLSDSGFEVTVLDEKESVVEEIKNQGIEALFIEPEYEGSSADILSNETGVMVYTLNPVLNGEKNKTAYEDIMRSNLEIIKAVK